jgi:hypothetical protein
MLIADEAEMNRLMNQLPADRPVASPYLVLGTLDSKTWREGMSGSVAIHQVREHMADFQASCASTSRRAIGLEGTDRIAARTIGWNGPPCTARSCSTIGILRGNNSR